MSSINDHDTWQAVVDHHKNNGIITLLQVGTLPECRLHSAKAKALPNVALDKDLSTKKLSAKISLSSAKYWALGKGFAECKVSTR